MTTTLALGLFLSLGHAQPGDAEKPATGFGAVASYQAGPVIPGAVALVSGNARAVFKKDSGTAGAGPAIRPIGVASVAGQLVATATLLLKGGGSPRQAFHQEQAMKDKVATDHLLTLSSGPLNSNLN